MDKETKVLLKNLQEIIDTIKDALDKDAIKAAFFCSLSIPDICGQLEFPHLRKAEKGNVGERYKGWYKENVYKYENPIYEENSGYQGSDKMNKIDEEIVYLLRCRLYHQGDLENKDVFKKLISKYKKEYPEKTVKLDFKFDADIDKISYMTWENQLLVEINVNPKVLAEKLMWNAEGVIRQFNKKSENVEEPI